MSTEREARVATDDVSPRRVDWAATAAAGFPFPEGLPAADVGGELADLLVARDPVVRDDHGYTAAARWIADGRLDGALVGLGDTAADRFGHPEVQARAFAPLLLSCVLRRAHAAPGLVPEATTRRWHAAFAAWYPAERDTRGWDDALGWLHAVAHGADAAAAFALVLPDRGPRLLELCARRMTAGDAEHRYTQLEDARLARAITRILGDPSRTAEQSTAWLAVVDEAFADAGPGPVPVWAFNTFATLQSLHLHLTLGLAGEGRPPHATAVADRVAAVLRLPMSWLA